MNVGVGGGAHRYWGETIGCLTVQAHVPSENPISSSSEIELSCDVFPSSLTNNNYACLWYEGVICFNVEMMTTWSSQLSRC